MVLKPWDSLIEVSTTSRDDMPPVPKLVRFSLCGGHNDILRVCSVRWSDVACDSAGVVLSAVRGVVKHSVCVSTHG